MPSRPPPHSRTPHTHTHSRARSPARVPPPPQGPTAPLIFVSEVVSGAFALSLTMFLGMHGQLIGANTTSIEMYEKDRLHPWPYNKGFRRNFEEVFGRK